MEKPKCERCDKVLVKIGTDRLNGSNQYCDWNSRKYHKKCYKAIKEEIENKIQFDQMMKRFKDEI